MALVLLAGATAVYAAGGFDEYGYNRTARIFNGPASGWCLERGASADCLGVYSQDKLVMKWNAEWDRGNAEGWANPPYQAWENNEWNGMVPGGSGEKEIVKIKWVGTCPDGENGPNGGYCIWGQFEVLMDHYTGKDSVWVAHASPTGYGAK